MEGDSGSRGVWLCAKCENAGASSMGGEGRNSFAGQLLCQKMATRLATSSHLTSLSRKGQHRARALKVHGVLCVTEVVVGANLPLESWTVALGRKLRWRGEWEAQVATQEVVGEAWRTCKWFWVKA